MWILTELLCARGVHDLQDHMSAVDVDMLAI